MEDYKERFIKEHDDLEERYNKLHQMLIKYDAGTLGWNPTTPISLLKEQEELMRQYLRVLDIRAEFESIDLSVKEEPKVKKPVAPRQSK